MSKGVILKLVSNKAYILTDDGGFIARPRDKSWKVADIITLPENKAWKYALTSCAAVFIVLLCSTGILYNIPKTYIEISVNPSIQLALNRFGRVINASGLNSDGINIIEGTSYKNLTLNEASVRIFDRLENNGVLSNGTIRLAIANDSQKELYKIEQALREVTESYVENNNARITVQRYALDEYQELSQALPVEDRLVSPTGQPTLQPTITSPAGSPTIPASPSPSVSPTPPASPEPTVIRTPPANAEPTIDPTLPAEAETTIKPTLPASVTPSIPAQQDNAEPEISPMPEDDAEPEISPTPTRKSPLMLQDIMADFDIDNLARPDGIELYHNPRRPAPPLPDEYYENLENNNRVQP